MLDRRCLQARARYKANKQLLLLLLLLLQVVVVLLLVAVAEGSQEEAQQKQARVSVHSDGSVMASTAASDTTASGSAGAGTQAKSTASTSTAKATSTAKTTAKTDGPPTVIWLHGLGDTGDGWRDVGKMFKRHMPNVQWYRRQAPMTQRLLL